MNVHSNPEMDPSGFVVLADFVPSVIQEIRYYSTYNFIGERIDGYEEPCALITKEAARALKAVSSELLVRGYRLRCSMPTAPPRQSDSSSFGEGLYRREVLPQPRQRR